MRVGVPATMAAVQLVGHGGFDQLVYRTDVPTPSPTADEVLLRVAAAGVNNTDINTRVGWYSKQVETATDAGATGGFDGVDGDGGWSGAMTFPRIQGADCCATVVAVGEGVDPARLGQRVLVRPMHEPPGGAAPQLVTFGSEIDGAFAQYAVVASRHAYTVESELSDAQLASMPCAWSTAEGMLHRASVGADDVIVTGASGGVGSAAVQLARRRGAHVTAVAASAKADAVLALGADVVIDRAVALDGGIEPGSADCVMDLVAGDMFGPLIDALRPGGRYVTSGAIAGPIVDLDVRDLYLKDLTLFGSTYQPPEVFENLIGYVERNEVRPVVADVYPLDQIVAAQERFLAKDFVGKLVLLPPGD